MIASLCSARLIKRSKDTVWFHQGNEETVCSDAMRGRATGIGRCRTDLCHWSSGACVTHAVESFLRPWEARLVLIAETELGPSIGRGLIPARFLQGSCKLGSPTISGSPHIR